jgi:hypothetical protein
MKKKINMSEALNKLEGKTLTPEKKSILVDEINVELKNINDSLRKGGTTEAKKTAIQSSKDVLQGVLNDLFSRRGVITPEETNKAITAIKDSKKSRLQSDFYSGIKKSTIVLVGFIAVVVGVYYYTKNKAK